MNTKQTLVINAGEMRGEQSLDIFGDQIVVKISGRDTDGSFAIMEGTNQPQSGPPLHRHGREDEVFNVIEGDYLFEVDGKQIHAGPGAIVFAPKGTVHTFQNVGKTLGRMLVTVQPAGLDSFFNDIDKATRGTPESDLSVVVPIFDKHGLELLGPPLRHRLVEPQVRAELTLANC